MQYDVKDMLEIAIQNNDSLWEAEVIDRLHGELERLYSQEAKAKAFDHIENLVKTELTNDDLYNDARNNDYAAGMLRVYERVDYIIDEYESGEPNAKK